MIESEYNFDDGQGVFLRRKRDSGLARAQKNQGDM